MYKYLSMIILTVFISSQFVIAAERDALVDAEISAGLQQNAAADISVTDGKAYAYKVEGKAMLTKSGSPVETTLKVGDLIQTGDKIYTEKGAVISIAFDSMKKNAVQIPAETSALFKSIEPTDIHLDDGTVFSAVDGLPKGSTWQVSTPSAVAAVRGTVYLVNYEASTGDFFAGTFDVADDDKVSAIEVQPVDGQGLANVPEGKEINLKEGDQPTNDMVQDLKPETVAEIREFFQELKSERNESEKDERSGNNNNPGDNGGGGNGPGDRGKPGDGEPGPGKGPSTFDREPLMPIAFDSAKDPLNPGTGPDFKESIDREPPEIIKPPERLQLDQINDMKGAFDDRHCGPECQARKKEHNS